MIDARLRKHVNACPHAYTLILSVPGGQASFPIIGIGKRRIIYFSIEADKPRIIKIASPRIIGVIENVK